VQGDDECGRKESEVSKKIYVVGIGGGTGSGKTTLRKGLLERLGDQAVAIPHDAYYRDQGHLSETDRGGYNFDHPEALETDLLLVHLQTLASGDSVEMPAYDFETHTRKDPPGATLVPRSVVIVEGVLVLAEEALRGQLDVKIFVEAAPDVRLSRRLVRDQRERGRDTESVIRQYEATVRPMHDQFVEPSRAFADVIYPGDREGGAGIDLLVAHLEYVIQNGSDR
jgi:uridine kinase